MPTYEFRCGTCDTVFEERRPMSRSSDPATCPGGHPGAKRLLSVFATASAGPDAPCGLPAKTAAAAPCGAACACH